MFHDRRRFLMVAMSACMAFFALLNVQANAFASGGGRQPRAEGTLISINPTLREVSIRSQGGAVSTYIIPTAAKVERNDRRAPLTAFINGDRVQLRFAADGKTILKFEGVGR